MNIQSVGKMAEKSEEYKKGWNDLIKHLKTLTIEYTVTEFDNKKEDVLIMNKEELNNLKLS